MKNISKIILYSIIITLIGTSLIEDIYWFKHTQVKSQELVTNRNIPLYDISGLYVDSDENFYIGIDNNNWIEKFNKKGDFICSIGMQAIVDNFYVDKEGLLHIICTYRNDDKYYEQVIDTDKNTIISEDEINNNIFNSINSNKFSINNKTYSIEKNIIKIKDGNYNQTITLDTHIRWVRILYDKLNIIEVIIFIALIIIIQCKFKSKKLFVNEHTEES